MGLNKFTSGKNTDFSDELNENFDISANTESLNRPLFQSNAALHLFDSSLEASTSADYETKTIPLDTDQEYFIGVDAFETTNTITSEGSNVEGLTFGSIRLQHALSTGGGGGATSDFQFDDGTNTVTIQAINSSDDSTNKNRQGVFLHDPQNYFVYSGTEEFSEFSFGNDISEEQEREFSVEKDISSLGSTYTIEEVSSGDDTASFTIDIKEFLASSPTIQREYSVDEGSTWQPLGAQGQVIRGESSVKIRVNATNTLEVNNTIIKPIA